MNNRLQNKEKREKKRKTSTTPCLGSNVSTSLQNDTVRFSSSVLEMFRQTVRIAR
ncbi:hypothetical protein PGB90_005306 [Kerria lacca]